MFSSAVPILKIVFFNHSCCFEVLVSWIIKVIRSIKIVLSKLSNSFEENVLFCVKMLLIIFDLNVRLFGELI